MSAPAGLIAYRVQFAVSPLILTGGIAFNVPGAAIPATFLLEGLNFLGGLFSEGGPVSTEDFFSVFQPLQGSTLIDNQVGMYPFANQQVAANAIIKNPLSISMLMICPVGNGSGYLSRTAIMQSIQGSFDSHNTNGGLYTVLTPSFAYTDCIMTSMTDISFPITKQVQNAWKLDFVKPLVSQAQAQAAQNSLMSKISANLPTDGALSGTGGFVGSNTPPITGAAGVAAGVGTISGPTTNSTAYSP